MTRTIILTLVVTFTSAFVSYAQEGDPIEPEEKMEPVVILEHEADSAQYVDDMPSSEEELQRPSPASNIFLNGRVAAGNLSTTGERSDKALKPKDVPTKSSYNFLYYLFYKFKKVDNQVD